MVLVAEATAPQVHFMMSSCRCGFCAQVNPARAKFCNECGSPLNLRLCPQCEAINGAGELACYQCRALLPDLAVAPVPQAALPVEDAPPPVHDAAPAMHDASPPVLDAWPTSATDAVAAEPASFAIPPGDAFHAAADAPREHVYVDPPVAEADLAVAEATPFTIGSDGTLDAEEHRPLPETAAAHLATTGQPVPPPTAAAAFAAAERKRSTARAVVALVVIGVAALAVSFAGLHPSSRLAWDAGRDVVHSLVDQVAASAQAAVVIVDRKLGARDSAGERSASSGTATPAEAGTTAPAAQSDAAQSKAAQTPASAGTPAAPATSAPAGPSASAPAEPSASAVPATTAATPDALTVQRAKQASTAPDLAQPSSSPPTAPLSSPVAAPVPDATSSAATATLANAPGKGASKAATRAASRHTARPSAASTAPGTADPQPLAHCTPGTAALSLC